MSALTWGDFSVSVAYGGILGLVLWLLHRRQIRNYKLMPPEKVIEEMARNRSPRRLILHILLPVIPAVIFLLYILPGWLGFRLNWASFMIGIAPYLIWQQLVALKFYRSVEMRSNEARMAERGQGGMRLALPRERRLRDFSSVYWRMAPFLIWFVGTQAAVTGHLLGFGQSGPNGLTFILTLALVTIPGMVFFYWFAGRVIREPIDLRSDDPAHFTTDVEKYLRQRGNSVLAMASAAMLGTVSLELVLGFGLPYWPLWVVWLLFGLSGLWCAIGGANQLAALERKRWNAQEAQEALPN
ncbi:hypothetical protein F3N42_13605 [Marinihelvus fidelis]|uniref:Uncharacterized protein n=1 Tax=Marinihelvus fidelis TaxID=2613842 RepID=A0A5N0T5Z4_9GAMM|nr:hypothetical protein [Marinihelvus fidelis]KAA9130198.1 hypothetical protein F3N42_13605 [Marinihelvus fidelis]